MAFERWLKSLLPAAIVIVALSVQQARGGNTTCVSNQLNWYTSVVGESPCVTYQRLRQICNSEYEVPSFPSTVPPDRCDDPVAECCCNMVSFQLSMLCMVCQQDVQDSSVGIDAPVGTYTVYREMCGAGDNHTLPSDLQSAICNKHIRIDNFLYDSWATGDWFYRWTKDNAQRLHAVYNNNTFTHCPDQISSSSTPTSASSTISNAMSLTSQVSSPTTVSLSNTENTQAPSPTPAQSQSELIGGIVGGVLGAIVIIIVALLIWRRKRVRGSTLQGTRGDRFGYRDSVEAPRMVSARAHPVAPNRLGGEGSGLTPPAVRGNDPFTSAEISSTTPGPGTWGGTAASLTETQPSDRLTEPSLRHRDGGSFGMGLARSNSGRLPPAYDHTWEDNHQRPTQPNSTGFVSAPTPNDSGVEISGGHTMPSAIPPPTSRPRVGEKARRYDRKYPYLFN